MRSSRILLLLTFAASASGATLFACGGDNGTGNDGGGNDATTDVAQTKDSAPDTTTTDSGGNDAGTDAPATNDAGDGGTVINVSCTNPTTCDAGSPYCCANVTLNGGTPPNCNISSVTAACAATCNTQLQFSCTTNETVRLCNANSDCTEPAYNKCCTFQTGSQTTTFCANAQIAAFADAGCM